MYLNKNRQVVFRSTPVNKLYNASIMPQSRVVVPNHFLPPIKYEETLQALQQIEEPPQEIVEEPIVEEENKIELNDCSALPPIENIYPENKLEVQKLSPETVAEPKPEPKLALVVQQVILNMKKAKVNGWTTI